MRLHPLQIGSIALSLSACAPAIQNCDEEVYDFVEAGYARAAQLLGEGGEIQDTMEQLWPDDVALGTTQAQIRAQLEASGVECVGSDDARLEAETTIAQWDSENQNVLLNIEHSVWEEDQEMYDAGQAIETPRRLEIWAQSWDDYYELGYNALGEKEEGNPLCETEGFQKGFEPIYWGQASEDGIGTLIIHEVSHELLGPHDETQQHELSNGRGELDVINAWHHAANLVAYRERQESVAHFSYTAPCRFKIGDVYRIYDNQLNEQ